MLAKQCEPPSETLGVCAIVNRKEILGLMCVLEPLLCIVGVYAIVNRRRLESLRQSASSLDG